MGAGHPVCGPGDEMGARAAGPTVARMLLGGRLRQLREASGMTRADAGWAIRGSYTKIGRLESGRSSFKRRDVADLLTLYGVSDETERAGLLALMEEANAPGWRDEYADILLGSAAKRLALEQCASQFAGAIYVDKPADVQHYGQVMDRLCTRAELPAATPAFLRRLSKEIGNI